MEGWRDGWWWLVGSLTFRSHLEVQPVEVEVELEGERGREREEGRERCLKRRWADEFWKWRFGNGGVVAVWLGHGGRGVWVELRRSERCMAVMGLYEGFL